MERKANRFVSLLASKLLESGGTDKSAKECNVVLKKAIALTPHGRLRLELQKHVVLYSKRFYRNYRCIRKSNRQAGSSILTDQLADDSMMSYPFNLYADHGLQDATSGLQQLNKTERSKQAKNLLATSYLGNEERLFNQIRKYWTDSMTGDSKMDPLQVLRIESTLLYHQHGIISLHRFLGSCVEIMTSVVDTILSSSDRERAGEVQKFMQDLLVYLHFKHDRTHHLKELEDRKHMYEDHIAALLSIYVDVTALLARITENTKAMSRRVVSSVHLLLGDTKSHSLDVVLQLTRPSHHDAPFLLPLLQYVIGKPPSPLTPAIYIKYVCVCRLARSILQPCHEQQLTALIQPALAVSPPRDTGSWLMEHSPELAGRILVHAKGNKLTNFLLQVASHDLCEKLLDLISHIECEVATADSTQASSQGGDVLETDDGTVFMETSRDSVEVSIVEHSEIDSEDVLGGGNTSQSEETGDERMEVEDGKAQSKEEKGTGNESGSGNQEEIVVIVEDDQTKLEEHTDLKSCMNEEEDEKDNIGSKDEQEEVVSEDFLEADEDILFKVVEGDDELRSEDKENKERNQNHINGINRERDCNAEEKEGNGDFKEQGHDVITAEENDMTLVLELSDSESENSESDVIQTNDGQKRRSPRLADRKDHVQTTLLKYFSPKDEKHTDLSSGEQTSACKRPENESELSDRSSLRVSQRKRPENKLEQPIRSPIRVSPRKRTISNTSRNSDATILGSKTPICQADVSPRKRSRLRNGSGEGSDTDMKERPRIKVSVSEKSNLNVTVSNSSLPSPRLDLDTVDGSVLVKKSPRRRQAVPYCEGNSSHQQTTEEDSVTEVRNLRRGVKSLAFHGDGKVTTNHEASNHPEKGVAMTTDIVSNSEDDSDSLDIIPDSDDESIDLRHSQLRLSLRRIKNLDSFLSSSEKHNSKITDKMSNNVSMPITRTRQAKVQSPFCVSYLKSETGRSARKTPPENKRCKDVEDGVISPIVGDSTCNTPLTSIKPRNMLEGKSEVSSVKNTSSKGAVEERLLNLDAADVTKDSRTNSSHKDKTRSLNDKNSAKGSSHPKAKTTPTNYPLNVSSRLGRDSSRRRISSIFQDEKITGTCKQSLSQQKGGKPEEDCTDQKCVIKSSSDVTETHIGIRTRATKSVSKAVASEGKSRLTLAERDLRASSRDQVRESYRLRDSHVQLSDNIPQLVRLSSRRRKSKSPKETPSNSRKAHTGTTSE